MAIVLAEKIDSRRSQTGDDAWEELSYLVTGTSDEALARSQVVDATPAQRTQAQSPGVTYILWRQTVQPEAEWVDEDADDGKWNVIVRYGIRPPLSAGLSSYSFETTGGTQHTTQSLQTVGVYAPSGRTAPNMHGAIGVTHDRVEGVDITVPVYHFSETHTLSIVFVNNSYLGTLFNLTGTVNNARFRGFQAGECLFHGVTGSKHGYDNWELTYRFSALPNRTDLVVGGITRIAKRGWDYLWVRYEDSEDSVAHTVVKRPTAVYVEQVYYFTNFAKLGIGT
jgi:hypothetical protein